ncbi:MAG TPA: dephospho-CoA kinase [Thermoanaerobaculia bacterium]|nr:dephospho-CoA kinase [Thermoanaerobaculia bacterium]
MILEVGLTGGLASGKSTVARTLAALGALTIDADHVVSHLYRPGEAGHAALVREYGPEILRPDGEIDRARLADIAFATTQSAQRLNALIHPLVIAEERRLIDAESERFPERGRIVVNEATLLLEAGGRARYDKIVVVDVPPEVQVERAVARGMSRDDAVRRIARQMPREERLRYADYVIDNSGSARELEVQTHRVFDALKDDLAEKRQKAEGKRQKSS